MTEYIGPPTVKPLASLIEKMNGSNGKVANVNDDVWKKVPEKNMPIASPTNWLRFKELESADMFCL